MAGPPSRVVSRHRASDGHTAFRKRRGIDLEGMPGDLPPIVISHQPLALDAVQSAPGPGAESRIEPLRKRRNIADLHEFRIRGANLAMRRNIAQDGGAAVAHR